MAMELKLADARDHEVLVANYSGHFAASREDADRVARLATGSERCLMMMEGAELLGQVTWGIREASASGLAQLTLLTVSGRMRRKGLGTLLVLSAIDDMTQVFRTRGARLRRAFLMADQENIPLRRLVEKLGFTAAAALPHHRGRGTTDLVYVHDVPESRA